LDLVFCSFKAPDGLLDLRCLVRQSAENLLGGRNVRAQRVVDASHLIELRPQIAWGDAIAPSAVGVPVIVVAALRIVGLWVVGLRNATSFPVSVASFA
jgi:uncharacterized membrane protein YfbV (UPF0208 family)